MAGPVPKQLRGIKRGPAYPDDAIEAAWIAELGVDSLAAKRLGCSVRTIARWRERNPNVSFSYRQVLDAHGEELYSRGLTKALQREEPWAIRFYGKHKLNRFDLSGSPTAEPDPLQIDAANLTNEEAIQLYRLLGKCESKPGD